MLACQTQWRTGFGGATGLDYNALFQVAAALAIKVDAGVLRKIALMESAMLEKWHKEKPKEKPKRRA